APRRSGRVPPAPAGGGGAGICPPATDSGFPLNDSAFDNPVAFRLIIPSASTPRTTVLLIQVSRGRTAMTRPTRAHRPLEVGSAEPNAGRRGQNTHRPVITSSAGSSVSMAATATTTPLARTPPLPPGAFRP